MIKTIFIIITILFSNGVTEKAFVNPDHIVSMGNDTMEGSGCFVVLDDDITFSTVETCNEINAMIRNAK